MSMGKLQQYARKDQEKEKMEILINKNKMSTTIFSSAESLNHAAFSTFLTRCP